MEGPRAPASTEYPEILSFLDKSLRPDHKWSIASEYPTALQPTNLHNIRIIKDGQEVLSHAVIKPLILKTPIAIYKVAAIGSVVTSSNHRKLGLSSQIVQACLTEAEVQNCDLAVLWTDLFDFYRKFGFEVAGSELSILIDHDMPNRMPGMIFKEGANVDPAAILKLYNRHTVGTVRTQEEIRQFLKIPNSRFYTCWDTKGTLLAYAAEGKGADLNGYIHEWGGGVTEVMNLVDEIRTRQNRNLTLIAPSHAVNIADRYRQLNYKVLDGLLGMIKIVNFDHFASKVLRHAKQDYGASQFILEKSVDGYVLGNQDQRIHLHDESSLIRILFGPQRPSEMMELDTSLAETLDRILPLRLWFWGWDSI